MRVLFVLVFALSQTSVQADTGQKWDFSTMLDRVGGVVSSATLRKESVQKIGHLTIICFEDYFSIGINFENATIQSGQIVIDYRLNVSKPKQITWESYGGGAMITGKRAVKLFNKITASKLFNVQIKDKLFTFDMEGLDEYKERFLDICTL